MGTYELIHITPIKECCQMQHRYHQYLAQNKRSLNVEKIVENCALQHVNF